MPALLDNVSKELKTSSDVEFNEKNYTQSGIHFESVVPESRGGDQLDAVFRGGHGGVGGTRPGRGERGAGSGDEGGESAPSMMRL